MQHKAMVASICGPLMNKVKMSFQYPRKNVDLAHNKDVRNLIFLLAEQIIPQWCLKQLENENGEAINIMHNLVYLLA
jgi:hypothetical protein